MTIYQSDYAKGIKQAPYPSESGVAVAHRFSMQAPAILAINDILELAPLPPGYRVRDIVLDVDDLDGAGPAIVLDVGLMSGDVGSADPARTCGAEFLDAVTTAQAGGVARATLTKAFRTTVSDRARSIGVKVKTAAATPQAGAIGLTVIYAAD